MPELPEVETVKRGLAERVEHSRIEKIIVRRADLRWPIPADLADHLLQQTISRISRRGKYLIFSLDHGYLLIHLGMSGTLRLWDKDREPSAHDHVDIQLSSGYLLRYNDPRRFGAMLWTEDINSHPLLKCIGVEPLTEAFSADYLYPLLQRHRLAIKALLLNGKIIAGIGNIYAAEALFLAGIHPLSPANALGYEHCGQLVIAIKQILTRAIEAGGSSLKDYVNSEGKPGYFVQQLYVYGRQGLECRQCAAPLKSLIIGQRSTVYCEGCQTRFPGQAALRINS